MVLSTTRIAISMMVYDDTGAVLRLVGALVVLVSILVVTLRLANKLLIAALSVLEFIGLWWQAFGEMLSYRPYLGYSPG